MTSPNLTSPTRAETLDVGLAHLKLGHRPVPGLQPPEPAAGAKEGKEGGGDAPPLPPSNGAFLKQVIRDMAEGAGAAVCSKVGDPNEGGWRAEAADNVDRQCPPGCNNYFNCSSFTRDDDGKLLARKDRFSGYHVLVLDDVGTKVDRTLIGDATPTWEIETSPGNSQVGFRLSTPLLDAADVKQLQDAVIASGLCDPAANGVGRWVRLPHAINGKGKYTHVGKPFECRLLQWNPNAAYTVEELVAALGLTLAPPITRAAKIPPGVSHAAVAAVLVGNDVWSPPPAESPVVSALKDRGLHKRETAPGRHEITCPWVNEHTDSLDTGAAYWEPHGDRVVGGFKCQHSHGDKYHIGELLKWLELDPDAARGKARIKLVSGEMNRVRRASEAALTLRSGFFQSGGAIVSLRTDPSTGDVSTELLGEPALTSALADAADWMRFDKGEKKYVRCDPPARNVQALLKAQGFTFLPPLRGLARQPFFRDRDGELVSTPGYDEAAQRYAAFEPDQFILPEPTEAAARDALKTLSDLLDEFRFASPQDRSAALCAMLTAAVRPTLPIAPAFNITASSSGSGKSYLASTITPFAGPGVPLKVSYPTDGTEASKAMLAALQPGPAVILFDDMQTQWLPHGAINRMLTSDTISDRLLGQTRTITVSTRCLILGTGNNIGPVRDMNRRVVTIKLHHRHGTPALVRYDGRPAELLAKNRATYVAAALTIIAAWKQEGEPKADVSEIASFGDWSDLCRQPLLWLGLPDPASSIIEQLHDDPDQDALAGLLRAWHAAFGERPVTLRQVIEMASDDDNLHEALLDLPVVTRDVIDRNRLGWYFKHNVGRPVGGLELQKAKLSERNGWRVVPVEDHAPD